MWTMAKCSRQAEIKKRCASPTPALAYENTGAPLSLALDVREITHKSQRKNRESIYSEQIEREESRTHTRSYFRPATA